MSIFNGTADDIFNKKTDYPVGSVCMFNTNIDPNEMYGGTWVRIKGKFIFGADDDTYPLGSEGGEEKHTLTEAELPHISGKLFNFALQTKNDTVGTSGVFKPNTGSMWSGYATEGGQSDTRSDNVEFSFGSGQPHNNMPPYVAFYIWAKVA